MKYHMTAFFLGFLLDLMAGDPRGIPHPVRMIGKIIAAAERRLLGETVFRTPADASKRGILLVVTVLAAAAVPAAAVTAGTYMLGPVFGVLAETVMTWQILAAKDLKDESMKVYRCLQEGDLNAARKAVSMIVGRDTGTLDEEGVIKAAVETVAENTSDGVIAPMLYAALGGPVAGLLYKAVNTMDSMVGYKNDRYLYFGRAAAKLDDAVNFLPARISAVLMIAASFSAGKDLDGRRAYRIYLRDRRKHASPNSAQTEAVCAGALGIRLAGDAGK